jgi:hypothetical protein
LNNPAKYPDLNLPAYDFKVRSIEEQIQIFDAFRKKFIALTPEEWVRQHFAHYLVSYLNYPASRIQLEFQIKYHRKVKRPDLVVVNDFGHPHILVECKAPSVVLNEDVFLQLTTYFQVLRPAFMVMTNGLQHIVATTQLNAGSLVYLEALPMHQ